MLNPIRTLGTSRKPAVVTMVSAWLPVTATIMDCPENHFAAAGTPSAYSPVTTSNAQSQRSQRCASLAPSPIPTRNALSSAACTCSMSPSSVVSALM
jgi:hypothetical protein